MGRWRALSLRFSVARKRRWRRHGPVTMTMIEEAGQSRVASALARMWGRAGWVLGKRPIARLAGGKGRGGR